MAANLQYILEQGACIPEDMMLDYVEGKLSAPRSHAVEKHLLECEMCSDALEGLKMMKASDSKSIISDLNKAIDNRISASAAKVIPFRFNFKAAAVITLFLLAGGSYWYMKNRVDEKMLAQNNVASVTTDTVSAQLIPLENSDQKSAEPVSVQPKFSPDPKRKPEHQEEIKAETKSHQLVNEDDAAKQLNDNLFLKDKAAISEVKEANDELSKRQSGSASEVNRQSDAAAPVIETTVSAKMPETKKIDSYTNEEVSGARGMSDAEFEISYPFYQSAKKKYEQKKYKEASIDFEKLINDTSGKYYDDAKWLLANCYLKLNESSKSQKILVEISHSNSIHKKEAELLIPKN